MLRNYTSNHSEYFYCVNCLNSFRTKKRKYNSHERVCENKKYCETIMVHELIPFFGFTQGTKHNMDFSWPQGVYYDGLSHQNEFSLFSNTKMNVTNSWSGKSKWKNGVICLVSMLPSWVMVCKLSKKVHMCIFYNFVLTSARNLSLLKQFRYMHLKVIITLFQKILWFIVVSATVDEILAIKIPKKMLTQLKLNKIPQLQTLTSPKK